MSGKLFLHIGRNRAGSTTLQNGWLRHADALRRSGVQYALFGQQSPPGHDLQSFSSHSALERYVQDRPSSSVLVSHEGLCCFQRKFAEAMASDLAKLDITLIVYIRPYREWVASDYVFNVLIGEQTEDFDCYMTALGEKVSFWPALKVWGDAIGWDRVRVRSLHPDDLVGGDLVLDGMAAIGVAPPMSAPAPRDNASPAWISTELIRFLLAEPTDTRRPVERLGIGAVLRTAELIDYEVRVAASNGGIRLDRGNYLTAIQGSYLSRLYNTDLERIANRTGQSLRRDDAVDERPRKFSPSIEHAPSKFLCSLQQALGRGTFLDELRRVIGDRSIDAFLTLDQVGE